MRDSQTLREVGTDKQLKARCQWAILCSKGSNLNSKALSRNAYRALFFAEWKRQGNWKAHVYRPLGVPFWKLALVSLENFRILFPPLPPSPSEIRDVHTDEIKSSCICPPLSGWKPRSNHYYILCTQCCPRKRGMSSLYIVTRSYCTSGIKGAHSLEFFLPCVDKRDANLAVLL